MQIAVSRMGKPPSSRKAFAVAMKGCANWPARYLPGMAGSVAGLAAALVIPAVLAPHRPI